jgi:SAM-dependent methyltransferase
VNYSESHLWIGREYEERFLTPPVASQFKYEKIIIQKTVQKYLPKRILDFACGTGRITKLLEQYCSQDTCIIGLDVSESMLAVARANLSRSKLIRFNFRSEKTSMVQQDFVTAFRFFCNAEHELREDAIEFIEKIIKSEGYLLLNMHNNRFSFSNYLLSIWTRRIIGVSDKPLLSQLQRRGFDRIASWSLGIWPQDHRRYYFSNRIGRAIENINFRWFATKHRIGLNNIYLFKYQKNKELSHLTNEAMNNLVDTGYQP